MNTFRTLAGAAMLWALVLSLEVAYAADDREQSLLVTLGSDSPAAEKAIACKQLAVFGSKDAVPALANLLGNEQLASWARIALEAIPGAEADAALRSALGSLDGKLLVGTINSIGVRRDAAAVEPLVALLKHSDADVAAAAAVALGKIGDPAATQALRGALASVPASLRAAVAEGCILCAERLMADGKAEQASEIYDEVRKAEVPKQKKLEATRGVILARKSQGIPLLVEQLRSPVLSWFRLGLTTARELPGNDVAAALVSELPQASAERAALLLAAFADRPDAKITPAVLKVAQQGPAELRIAAINVIGRLGDASSLPTLVEIAAGDDAAVAEAAQNALATLPGEEVNSEILARLSSAQGKALGVLIDLVGRRRLAATAALVKALDHSDANLREAALKALGATIKPEELQVLVSQVVAPNHAADAAVAQQALRAASVRMPDRESCAAELAAALPRATPAAKTALLETLGEVGGAKALATIAAAVKGTDPALQDAGSRALGQWMELDAAPVLLDLSKTAPGEKYQVRALRGYIRLARQFAKSDRQRAEMCQTALGASARADEQKVVLTVLQSYPSPETLEVAMQAQQKPVLRDDATRTALVIIQKLGPKAGDVPALLAKLGMDGLKVEIVKAIYGAGGQQKDVTELLRKQAGNLPLIALPAKSYSASFGGDPAPGVPKQLKVQYRINGRDGEASFPEDSLVMLPMPGQKP